MFVGSNFKWSLWWHCRYQFSLHTFGIPKLHCKCVAKWILIQHLRYGYRHLVNDLHVTWLKLLGSKFFFDPKKWERYLAETNRLVKDRSRKWGSITERSLSKLAPDGGGDLSCRSIGAIALFSLPCKTTANLIWFFLNMLSFLAITCFGVGTDIDPSAVSRLAIRSTTKSCVNL